MQIEIGYDFWIEKADGVGGNGVGKPWSKFLGHGGAAHDAIALKNDDSQSRASEIGRAGQTIVTRADYRDVKKVGDH